VRHGLHHGRPREVPIHLALTWRLPRHQARDPRQAPPDEPWYPACSRPDAQRAAAWYRQRWRIEESFKDSKTRFRRKYAQVGCPERLTRLLMALTIALCWLTLAALPESGALPPGWHAAATTWGRASVVSLALTLLDDRRDLPLPWLPTIH